MSTGWRKRLRGGWIQVGSSLLVLVATLVAFGRGSFWRQLAHLQPRWLGLAALILLAQFPLMTARWRLFARELGVPLPFRRALSEYFLATFLNQVLPLGVLGDVTRAIRHSKVGDDASSPSYANTALAVVLERASGQMGLWLVVLAILPGWASQIPWGSSGIFLGALAVLVAAGAIALLVRRSRASQSWQRSIRQSLRALLALRTLLLHLPLSLLLVLSHVVAFVSIAYAFGLTLSFELAMHVVPLVLVVTSLPFFLGGWGVREATVAGLYHLAGFAAADGVSVAMVYGGLSLVVSVPGLWALRPRLVARPATDSGAVKT